VIDGVSYLRSRSRHQPKIMLQPPEEREQHLRRAILLLARERAEILDHLFEPLPVR
jgi:hypothetical protein